MISKLLKLFQRPTRILKSHMPPDIVWHTNYPASIMTPEEVANLTEIEGLLIQAKTITSAMHPSSNQRAYEFFRDMEDDIRTGIENVQTILANHNTASS
jgi:hypothetical protein